METHLYSHMCVLHDLWLCVASVSTSDLFGRVKVKMLSGLVTPSLVFMSEGCVFDTGNLLFRDLDAMNESRDFGD